MRNCCGGLPEEFDAQFAAGRSSAGPSNGLAAANLERHGADVIERGAIERAKGSLDR